MKLSEIGGGALDERFAMAFDELMENIKNLNTDSKPARKITITLAVRTDTTRSVAEMVYDVKTSLPATRALSTNLMFDRDPDTGKPIAKEFGSQIPGQTAMPGVGRENNVIPMNGGK